MKPEAQREAIATACGWIYEPGNDAGEWYHEKVGEGSLKIVPSYLTDLNAMHEAEKVLEDKIKTHGDYAIVSDYNQELEQVCFRSAKVGDGIWIVHATAAQRAEAFLRTIGKWEGQPEDAKEGRK